MATLVAIAGLTVWMYVMPEGELTRKGNALRHVLWNGAFYGSLRLWQYIPQTLAAGAVSITAINYFFYHRGASLAGADRLKLTRRSMVVSAAIGLAVMVTSFILPEWLNHAVVNSQRFMIHSEYGLALIHGVPNIHLAYALATFLALPVLWILPFKKEVS